MKPSRNARRLLGVTHSKAKMWEYYVPISEHILIEENPEKLFDLTIGVLGDVAANINGEEHFSQEQLNELKSSLKFASQCYRSRFLAGDFSKCLSWEGDGRPPVLTKSVTPRTHSPKPL